MLSSVIAQLQYPDDIIIYSFQVDLPLDFARLWFIHFWAVGDGGGDFDILSSFSLPALPQAT